MFNDSALCVPKDMQEPKTLSVVHDGHYSTCVLSWQERRLCLVVLGSWSKQAPAIVAGGGGKAHPCLPSFLFGPRCSPCPSFSIRRRCHHPPAPSAQSAMGLHFHHKQALHTMHVLPFLPHQLPLFLSHRSGENYSAQLHDLLFQLHELIVHDAGRIVA